MTGTKSHTLVLQAMKMGLLYLGRWLISTEYFLISHECMENENSDTT